MFWHSDTTPEVGDYGQVNEYDAEVIAVDPLGRTVTLEVYSGADGEPEIREADY